MRGCASAAADFFAPMRPFPNETAVQLPAGGVWDYSVPLPRSDRSPAMFAFTAACLFATLPVQPPVEAVTDSHLHAAYAGNALEADARYKGKSLTVEGVVKEIKSEGGRYTVVFGVAFDRRNRLVAGVAGTVAASAEEDFRGIKPFDRITLAGTCRGVKKDYAAYKERLVVLDDCRRVK
jgi:hypothetical protein